MLYAAYGSNLNVWQMGFRCPSAKRVGVATLRDYRLLFKGSKSGNYLTVERALGHEVPLGIWEVDAEDEAALDRYEGYPSFYYKKRILITLGGKRRQCMIYIMREDALMGIPDKYYMNTCLNGYLDFGFDPAYLREAYRYSKVRRGCVA